MRIILPQWITVSSRIKSLRDESPDSRECQPGVELSSKVRQRRRKHAEYKIAQRAQRVASTRPAGVPGQIHLDSSVLTGREIRNEWKYEFPWRRSVFCRENEKFFRSNMFCERVMGGCARSNAETTERDS